MKKTITYKKSTIALHTPYTYTMVIHNNNAVINNRPQNNKNIQYQATMVNFTRYIQITDNYIEGDRKTHTLYDNHYSYGVLIGDSPQQRLDIEFINCTNNTFNGFDIAIYVPNSSYHNSFAKRIDNTNFFHYLYQYYTFPTNLIQ